MSKVGFGSRLYKGIISFWDPIVPKSLRPLWDHPAGPKTIHFWAPAFKWGLVIGGLGDVINRPVEKLSIPQCASLAVTGIIWSRFSVVIIPVNYSLLSVNAAVALINILQVARAYKYHLDQQKLKEEKKDKK